MNMKNIKYVINVLDSGYLLTVYENGCITCEFGFSNLDELFKQLSLKMDENQRQETVCGDKV